MKTLNATQAQIIELQERYPNEHVIAIFGGAIYDAEKIDNGVFDFEEFAYHALTAARNACFYRWHGDVLNAIKTYCHICFVDPALLEAYLGTRLNVIANEIKEHYTKKNVRR